ncbi:MAG TPA: hypothetical protein VFL14_16505, partial [Xanthomonadales bacterium]|nr:hypothetical protein [Xanthomonadales bacterium]
VTADGVQMLRQRIAEVGPGAELEKISGTDVFVDALGKSAKNTATAVGKAVTNPVATMKAVPTGVGRFFKSAGDSAKSATSGDAGNASDATKDALGINKAKRGLAKKVGVDPYTTNPVVAKRLDSLANAAFAGGVSLDVVMAVSTAGVATALSVTKTVSNLAWDLPPEDVRKRNDQALTTLGIAAGNRSALLGNRWYTPTMALAFVESLKALGTKGGGDAFVALAAKSESESEARFYIAQLVMAKQYAAGGDAIASIEAPGQVGVFRTTGGNAFVPAAADWLALTDGVATFAKTPVAGAKQKFVWLTGKASPAAKQALAAGGWTLREAVALE